MRVLQIAIVGALALIATCGPVTAENSKTVKLNGAASVRELASDDKRSLRTPYDPDDSDNLDGLNDLDDDSEERSFQEILKVEERAVANAKYRRWYKAELTPKQVKKALGVKKVNSMTKTQRGLQRLYLGYYSYYHAKHRGSRGKE